MNADPRSKRRVPPTRTAPVIPTLLALLIAGLLLASAGCASASNPPGTIAGSALQPTDEQVIEAYGKLPLGFVSNQGQVAEEQVRYHAQGAGFGFFFTPTGAMLSFVEDAPDSGSEAEEEPAAARGFALALDFLEANPEAQIEAREELAGKVNYLRGSHPAEHQTNLPTYGELVYRDLWPGVDVTVRGEEGALKYEFLVEPGARVEDIGLAYRGADGFSLDEEGDLRISTPMGELTDSAPVSYQEVDGEQAPVESRYVLDEGAGSYGFEVGAGYDPARPLVIDPGLAYSTFLGAGGSLDQGRSIAVDQFGNAYVTGETLSVAYPTTPGAFDTTQNLGYDAFATKFDADGAALAYSTFLGGTGTDRGYGIAVDASGNAYVTGQTGSPDYPTTTSAFDTTHNSGYSDAFVTKLNADGATLAYSTFLGGASLDQGRSIAVDQFDNAYVTGETRSVAYPTTPGAFDTTHNGGDYDAFATKLNAGGAALAYSTFLGGTSVDLGYGIAVDASGNAYVTGQTSSPTYPTTAGAFDTMRNGYSDAFATKLNADGATLAYSTFLGGTSSEFGWGIAVDQLGNAYVTGQTRSVAYPTTPGAFDTTQNGDYDAFATKLNAIGSALAYSTFLGESFTDQGLGIAVDASGNAYVTGRTSSAGYPTTPGAFDTTYNAAGDAFVTRLNADGSALAYSTFLGGKGLDLARGIAVDTSGNAYVTGPTFSTNYPTTPGAFDAIYHGNGDAFVTKLPTL